MNRFSLIFLLIIPALVLATAGGCSKQNEQKTVYEKKPTAVTVEKVKRGLFTRVLRYKGTVLPWQRANIGPEVSGRIKKIFKKPGDTVQKNQLLAELDTTTMELRAKQAGAAVDVANAAYKDALLNYQRLEKLFQKTAVSRVQLEKAELALESAETQKKSARAQLDVLEHDLKNSSMRAPFNGIITSKNMEEGDVINPMMGMNVGIVTLMDLSKVKITLDVPSEDIEKINIGQACGVHVNTLPEEVFPGTVYSKNLAADVVSKTFKVEVEVANPGIKIKAGIFAEVEIEILNAGNVLTLPLSALLTDGDTEYVILYRNGTAVYKTVKTGRKNDRFVEILEGLDEGQSVVVEGNYDLKEKTSIIIKE